MHTGAGLLCVVLAAALASAGCLSAIFPDPVAPTPEITAAPSPVPTTNSPVATVRASDMALEPADMPADYILKERSDLTYRETEQVLRDLGWRDGYQVTYYRMNKAKDDLTGFRQVIGIYARENMNLVYNVKKDAVVAGTGSGETIYELPCPNLGEHTYAFRKPTADPFSSTYTIIFTKKNVYEELTMGGTTTDYETLKALARSAADKIH
ncbi:hypothetical protein [Methanoregula sp. UBA64]|uniref:hypothetical protein n=1 Tax=Methanoregula sp. UBA64 TaxID=1915554 RepID=UPI0025E75574|nr:hypothetical protein [Methanoregula sp. UBA64]